MPEANGTVCLAKTNLPQLSDPSRDYLAVLPIAAMASSVARADGSHTQDETETIYQRLVSMFSLTEAERTRLSLHLKWLEQTNTRVGKVTADRIDPSVRLIVGQILADIAIADGMTSQSEVKELVRLYGLLSIPEAALYSKLHATDGPVTIVPESRTQDYKIPSEPKTKGRSVVDLTKVQQKIRDTERVTTLLAEVFASEEVVETPEPQESDGQQDRIKELLGLLCPGSISAIDFQILAERTGFMKNAAVEALNDMSFELCQSPLIEGDDPLEIDDWALKELTQ
jgi:uncharacterized tellurite resistance protein B-like protein